MRSKRCFRYSRIGERQQGYLIDVRYRKEEGTIHKASANEGVMCQASWLLVRFILQYQYERKYQVPNTTDFGGKIVYLFRTVDSLCMDCCE